MEKMTSYGNTYLNICIKDLKKENEDGYTLNVSDIEDHELETLVGILFKHDPVTREELLNRIQDLIDERLPDIELSDRESRKYDYYEYAA